MLGISFRLSAPVLLCGAVLPILLGQQGQQRRHALLIGVNSYQKNQLRALKYAEKDAEALSGVLKSLGYTSVVLMTQSAGRTDQRLLPTARNIREQLRGLLAGCQRGDTVVVGFSGQGVQFKEDKVYAICPTDADLAERTTVVPLKEIYDELNRCQAQVKLLLLDGSRDELLIEGSLRNLDREKFERGANPQREPTPLGVVALFSCSEGQRSYESDRLKHAVFFHHVIEGLRGKAGKQTVSWPELVSHVKAETPGSVEQELGGEIRQNPSSTGTIADPAMPLFANTAPRPGDKGATVGKAVVKEVWGKAVTNSIGMKFVQVKAGRFKMGSPVGEALRKPDEDQHDVEISGDYWMGIHEVTQEQYERVTGENPSYFADTGPGKEKVEGMNTKSFPVERVSWQEARSYCDRMSSLDSEVKAGRRYRLPTDAEWEYACRGGHLAKTYQVVHFGRTLASTQANFNGTFSYGVAFKGPFLNRPCPVGSYPANALGLYDMHGNLWEYCSDWHEVGYYRKSPLLNPQGPTDGSFRVVRGGTWANPGSDCRSANRARTDPNHRSHICGFRVVASPFTDN